MIAPLHLRKGSYGPALLSTFSHKIRRWFAQLPIAYHIVCQDLLILSVELVPFSKKKNVLLCKAM